MLKFILVSSNEEVMRKYKEIIALNLMKKDLYYKCYKFKDNDKDLEDFIKLGHKHDIFLIHESEKISSIDIVRKIRVKYKNISPFIVIFNFDNPSINETIKNEFMYNVTTITDKSYISKLNSVLDELTINFSNQKECLRINSNKAIYKIPYSEILYIEKQPNSKISDIHCTTEVISVNISLSKIKEDLNDRFIQTHRSAIINIDNILKIDFNKRVIIFKNNEECYLISRSYKKDIENIFTK